MGISVESALGVKLAHELELGDAECVRKAQVALIASCAAAPKIQVLLPSGLLVLVRSGLE